MKTIVNIVVHLVDYAYQSNAEKLVIVSGDSDLIPPSQMIRLQFPPGKCGLRFNQNFGVFDCGHAIGLNNE